MRNRCLYAIHTALVRQLPIDVAVTAEASRTLCDLVLDDVEGRLCELQEFSAHSTESGLHLSAARILSHYEESCGFGDVSHVCRSFWLKSVIARLLVQLQHSMIDIEDAVAAADEAQQQHEVSAQSSCEGDILLSGVASLMWRHVRLVMAVGQLLVAARRFDEAEDKFRFCFIKRRAVVGASHPDTLKSQHALAETLFLQGNFTAAAAVAKECCSLRCSVLGASHTDSVSAACVALILHPQNLWRFSSPLNRSLAAGRCMPERCSCHTLPTLAWITRTWPRRSCRSACVQAAVRCSKLSIAGKDSSSRFCCF
jgi:hypothetical protein